MNNNYNEEKFDSFLNKTIILSSKLYYRNEIIRNTKELNIMDDKKYEEYLNKYLDYSQNMYNNENITDLMELCENPVLIRALKSLSNIEMTVIFLLFEKQLTSNEASKILKICSDSVTRIKRRAIRKIEKYFKDGDLDE